MKYWLLFFSCCFWLSLYSQNTKFSYDKKNRVQKILYPGNDIREYRYDKNGNLISFRSTTYRCPLNNLSYHADSACVSPSWYQWEVDSGNGFTNITESNHCSGTLTSTLELITIPTSWYGYKFRCKVTCEYKVMYNVPYTLIFSLRWTGAVSTAWEDPLNWNCYVIPDENTDVIIDTDLSNYPIVSSAAACRSLNILPGATIKVNDGIQFKIKGVNKN